MNKKAFLIGAIVFGLLAVISAFAVIALGKTHQLATMALYAIASIVCIHDFKESNNQ